jgi:hypothetical protein
VENCVHLFTECINFHRYTQELNEVNRILSIAMVSNKSAVPNLKAERNHLEELLEKKSDELGSLHKNSKNTSSEAPGQSEASPPTYDENGSVWQGFLSRSVVGDKSPSASQPICSRSSDYNPVCSCGLPTSMFTAKTDMNNGRNFFKCSLPTESNCGFFQWEDNGPNVSSVTSVSHLGVSQKSVKDPRVELQRRFGHKDFRLGQFECVKAALESKDVYCLMPTGGGKSVVYQVRSIYLLFFSPLRALPYSNSSYQPGVTTVLLLCSVHLSR